MLTTWRAAMTAALYGPGGFFVSGAGPAAHFRTSANASPAFVTALLGLVERVDAALGRPDVLDVVDVGAGQGELLTELARQAPAGVATRLRLTAVELAPRPDPLPATVHWRAEPPNGVTGLLLATEWLDNVPLDVARWQSTGWRRLLVESATGTERVGGPLDPAEAAWLAAWWPEPTGPAGPAGSDDPTETRAEIGLPRDLAWAAAVRAVDRGLALAVDYGHVRAARPPGGTLTGYRAGRQVPPVPDSFRDLTAHVAIDAVAAAGEVAAGLPYTLVSQRTALAALGIDGARPPLALASAAPARYVRALAAASAAAELSDPAGLGGHWWLLQPVGIDLPTGWLRERADRNQEPGGTPGTGGRGTMAR